MRVKHLLWLAFLVPLLSFGQAYTGGGNAYVPGISSGNGNYGPSGYCFIGNGSTMLPTWQMCSAGGGVSSVTGSNGVTASPTTGAVGVSLSPIAGGNILCAPTVGTPASPSACGNLPLSFGLNSIATLYDVQAYGAVCNGTPGSATGTDDTVAINSATAAIRALSAPNSIGSVILQFPKGKTCLIATSGGINLTGLRNLGLQVVGMNLTCATSGTPCVDALFSQSFEIDSPIIYGNATNPPSIGLQIGRKDTQTADNNIIIHPVIHGTFTQSSFYNFASELLTMFYPDFSQLSASTATHAIIQDGCNIWNVQSAYQTVTAVVGTAASFDGDMIIGGEYTAHADAPLWIAGANGLKFIRGYAATSATYGADLYSTSTCVTNNLDVDAHFETSALTDIFLITGTNASPSFLGFAYNDYYPEASNSLFKLDTGVTSAKIDDGDIHVSQFLAGNTVKTFDSASAWSYSGKIYVPNTGNWTTPARFSGSICYANQCDAYSNPVGSVTNTFAGNGAGAALTSGATFDTGFGRNALAALTVNGFATAFGSQAGAAHMGGSGSFFGYSAGANAITGMDAFGTSAGLNVSNGNTNVALGAFSMAGGASRITGSANTAVGDHSLNKLAGAASNNVGIGQLACGTTLTTGSNNLCLGPSTDVPTATTSNTVHIGTGNGDVMSATGTNVAASSIWNIPGFLDINNSVVSTGTKFTTTVCTNGSTVGGTTAGEYIITGVSNNCVVTLPTTTTAYSCSVSDTTTLADTQVMAASTTNSATFAGTTVTGDKIKFSCTAGAY